MIFSAVVIANRARQLVYYLIPTWIAKRRKDVSEGGFFLPQSFTNKADGQVLHVIEFI